VSWTTSEIGDGTAGTAPRGRQLVLTDTTWQMSKLISKSESCASRASHQLELRCRSRLRLPEEEEDEDEADREELREELLESRRDELAERRLFLRISPQRVIVTVPFTSPDLEPLSSINRSICMSPTSSPKTTCLPSSQGVALNRIKNCELFVFGPEFAIESKPALS